MKKHILSVFCLLMTSVTLMAQNPTETTIEVEFQTAEGTETVQHSSINSNSFTFIGGAGEVTNPVTGATMSEANQDLFMWVSDLDFNQAILHAALSSNIPLDGTELMGFCLSEKPSPTIENDFVKGDILSEDGTIQQTLTDLDYMSTYYVRPYITFSSGITMYGGEKSFTTPRTIAAALLNEADLREWNFYDEQTGIVLTPEALMTIAGYNEIPEKALQKGVLQDLKLFFSDQPEYATQLKAASYRSIECTDGTLYAVKTIPTKMSAEFQTFFFDGVTFSPYNYVYEGEHPMTKNVGSITTTPCEASWGVPNNSYTTFVPLNSATTPSIVISIPKYLHPQTYAMYVTLVNPDPELDPRGYKFQTVIWEKQANEAGDYKYSLKGGVTLNAPEGSGEGTNFLTDGTQRVTTLFLGNYTFSGAPESLIQLIPKMTSTEARTTYTRTMSIAQISLVPVKE